MNRLYPSSTSSSTYTLIVLAICLGLLSACGPKSKLRDASSTMEKPSVTTFSSAPVISQEIQYYLNLAQEESGLATALEGLSRLSQEAPGPLREEAAFRRVQVLLEKQQPEGLFEAQQLIQRFPNHALTPYAYFWIASWWQSQAFQSEIDSSINIDAINQSISALTLALKHPRLTQQLAKLSIDLGNLEIVHVSPNDAIVWYIQAAHVDGERQEQWLRSAASLLSFSSLKMLQEQGLISPTLDSPLYLYVARSQLMSGNTNDLKALDAYLSLENKHLPVTRKIHAWASGEIQEVYIGILLPLSGRYALFGEEALNGIRLALDEQAQSQHVHLYVEDTHGDDKAAIAAYQALILHNVDWVIGPLLSSNTEALLPYLKKDIPIISLSKENSLAEVSSALFVHNIAKETQAAFMAQYAYSQGIRQMSVLHGVGQDEYSEAQAFADTFTGLGGEIQINIEINTAASNINHIAELNALRESTDDEALLEELLSDLDLFSPETELETHLSTSMEGIYIATSGKQVSALAGQLAYVDIRDIALLGSDRWADGHLLDDRGRNLTSARFIQTSDALNTSPLLRHFHDVWGAGVPTKIFTTAYDSTRIAVLLGSRLGLHGEHAIQALHDPEGFQSESGHVTFDAQGVGHKIFNIWRVGGGKIIPASRL